MMSRAAVLFVATAIGSLSVAAAQQPGGVPPAAPSAQVAPANPRAAAPVDITGYWVSMVTEDWRWRVVTPPKGDVLYLPLNAEGRKAAETWDPAKDEAAGEQCRAYGAGGVMRIPGRLHITWENDQTLKLETDAGMQTRRFLFNAAAAPATAEPTWQGRSIAAWHYYGPTRGRGRGAMQGLELPTGEAAARPRGELRVVTRQLRPGYLRRNGVPYSENTSITEHFAKIREDNGDEYLVVTTILEDPKYLAAPYVRTYQFKKQADATGWNPTPCTVK